MTLYATREKVCLPFEAVNINLIEVCGNTITYDGGKALFIKSPSMVKKFGPSDDNFGNRTITYSLQTNQEFQKFIIDLEERILLLAPNEKGIPYKKILNQYNGDFQIQFKIKRDTITDCLQASKHYVVFSLTSLWEYAGKYGITVRCSEISN